MTVMKPNGTTEDLKVEVIDDDTKETFGWTAYNQSSHRNHYITFDFS